LFPRMVSSFIGELDLNLFGHLLKTCVPWRTELQEKVKCCKMLAQSVLK
jgi:hypothetical protein